MGKRKGDAFNLFESYLASGLANQSPMTTAPSSFIPLPDSMRTSTLLEQIGQERRWTEEQMNHDIVILEENRLYYVNDLRELSKSSWKAITLLPIVKDLLRKAIRTQEQPPEERDTTNRMLSTAAIADEPYYKLDKKSRKQYKKEKKQEKRRLKEKKHKAKISKPLLNQDPETVRNTIQNLTIEHTTSDNHNHSVTVPAEDVTIRKRVSFSSELPKDMTEQQTDDMSVSSDSSSTSSSSSSSSNSEDMQNGSQHRDSHSKGIIAYEDASTPAAASTLPSKNINHTIATASVSAESMLVDTDSSSSQKPKMFTGRPIKAISGNRIRVRAGDGDIFEVDRWCPHKHVDMATWGQVMGRTLICTKHNWRFSLDGFPLTKGKSINPCKVNDW